VKITRTESFVIHVPTGMGKTDFHYETSKWGFVGLNILTDDGVSGTGFTCTHCSGDEMIKQTIDQYLAPQLLGENPLHTKKLWDKLHSGNLHQVGRTGLVRMAHSAVDIALWDICAKAASLPLWMLLGGAKAGEEIPTYNSNVGWLGSSVAELLSKIGEAVEVGWKAVKITIGHRNPQNDIARVREVRSTFGDDFVIMIDGGEAWDLNTARCWGKRFEPLNVHWFEEPINAEDVDGHAILARDLDIPIALGENLLTRFSFRDFINRNAVGILQPDVTRVGGVTEWTAIADLAHCNNLPVIPHCGDMMVVHQHLVGATQNSPMIEYIPWGHDLFSNPPDIRNGFLKLPTIPGASTDMLPEMVKRYRVD
jgi:L-alanine-DL-glutamate epimerase-like enolase superfamily enzyme